MARKKELSEMSLAELRALAIGEYKASPRFQADIAVGNVDAAGNALRPLHECTKTP